MNMALTARCFQICFFFGCGYSILIAECLEINAFNTLGDGISFSPGSKAILQCVINPYTGGQTWKVDSVSVADCGFVLCVENSSNPDRYSFTPNVTTGSFIFTIDPILYRDDGNVIECLDGSSTINHTVVVADLTDSTCDRCDFEICIYLAIGELLHFIVSIQHIYQSFALYSFQKRIGSIRLIWLNFLAWFPIFGCLCFKGILEYCHEGQCLDCKEQCPAEGYCYNCKGNLCIECFKWHQPLHKTWQISKHECHDCKKETDAMDHMCTDWFNSHSAPEQHSERRQGKHKCHDCKKETHTREYCWICKDHICTDCFKSHFPPEEHPARTRGKHACHDCQKETDARHYCWICMDHLCTDCFNIHCTTDQQSAKRQGKHKCNNCKKETHTREYSWICKDHICTDCFKNHFTSDQQSPRRQGKHKCQDCQKETDVMHYCWICKDHICSDCFSRHFTSDQQSAKRQGKHECHNCKKETHTRKYSWICKDHICTDCFKSHFISEQHSARRQDKHECYDCQKETDTRHYCWICTNHLCSDCFNSHYTSDEQSARRQGNTCEECKAQCKPPEYCCLKCEWYLCRGCLQKSLNNHQCKQRKRGKCLKQGKPKCHDCQKDTYVGHYCLKCKDHICTDCFKRHFTPEHSARKQGATKCKHCDKSQEQPNIKGYCLTCSGFLCEHCLETNHSFDKHETRQIYKEVNNMKKKYQSRLALSCLPWFSWAGVIYLWIICWTNIRIQTITFILVAGAGCIIVIGHPFAVLTACLAACECETLQDLYIALIAIKYIFIGWIPSAIVLVFIKLLEDSFYCDDCKSNSQVHGYCIECNQYLCGRCVPKHRDMLHYILKHSQKIDTDTYFNTCCHDLRNEMFYCTQSKRFICKKCNDKPTNEHRKNTIHQHDKKRYTLSSFENHQRDKSCHDMLSDMDVCYTCFYKLSEIRRHIKDAFNQRLKCQYSIGDVQCQSTSADAYCLTCKLCLCQDCLVNHHLHLDGRECSESSCLFCDNCLRPDNEVKAEYYNVESECFLCANCIRMESYLKSNGHQAEGSQNTRRPKKVKERNPCEVHNAMANLRHEVEFTLPENTTTTDRVRCNVCKMVMCGTCFEDHFNITRFLHHYQYNAMVREKEKVSDTRWTCSQCSVKCEPEYCCLKCERYLCRACLEKKPTTSNNHQCGQHKKHGDLEEGKHECHDCTKETDAGHYCLICNDHICSYCFESHYASSQHSARRQGMKCCQCSVECKLEYCCLKCECYLCRACLEKKPITSNNHQCGQHKKHGDLEEGKHECHDCKKKTDAGHYCLICNDHICCECYESHYASSQHSVRRQGLYERDVYFACDGNNCREARVNTLCLDCKKHLCENCIKNEKDHEQSHATVKRKYFHDPLFRRKKIFCQNDHKGEEHPAECLDLRSKHAMCTSCFEDYNSTTNNTQGDQSKKCQLCPDKRNRPVNVYCLVCREYMCVTCFKWHRRFKQSWQEQGFYDMLEEKKIKEAEPSPKRSVPLSVVVRIIAGPFLLIELFILIRSLFSKDATVTPSEQDHLEKPKEREQPNQGQTTAETDVTVDVLSETKHRVVETEF